MHITPTLERLVRCIAVFLVIALIIGIAFVSFPFHNSDFTQFYCAGQMVRRGLGSGLYDLTTQMKFQTKVAPVQVFYNHPPFETLLFVPFTYVSYRNAYILWTLTGLCLLITAVFLIQSQTDLTTRISQFLGIRADVGLVTVLFLTFAPATTCMLLGQDSMLMLLVYSLVFTLLKRGSNFQAGCVLACGLFKFQLILPFAFVLFLCRKWTVLRGFSLIASLLLLVSLGVSGLGVLSSYPKLLLFDRTYQQIGGFAPEFMPNIRGLLHVLSFGRLRGPTLGAIIIGSSIVMLWYAAKHWRDERVAVSFSASLLATLLSSYHLYNYDLTLLLLPIAILFSELIGRHLPLGRSALAAALVVLFIPPLHRLLLLHSVYALMGVPVALLYAEALRLGSIATTVQACTANESSR